MLFQTHGMITNFGFLRWGSTEKCLNYNAASNAFTDFFSDNSVFLLNPQYKQICRQNLPYTGWKNWSAEDGCHKNNNKREIFYLVRGFESTRGRGGRGEGLLNDPCPPLNLPLIIIKNSLSPTIFFINKKKPSQKFKYGRI